MALSPADKIVRARAKLVVEHPFFGTLALRLTPVAVPGLKGATTDGTSLRYDPEYIDSITTEQCTGLVASTILHPAFLHHTRRGERDKDKWNRAADFAIAGIMASTNMALPDVINHNPAYDGMSAEHIYTLIPDNPKGGGGGGGGGASCNSGGGVDDMPKNQGQGNGDGDGDGNGNGEQNQDSNGQGQRPTQAELNEAERDWKQALAQAAHAAKQQGKLPAGMERLIQDLLEPSQNWKEILMRFMNEKAPDDFSWSRPNRRFIAGGLYLPSMMSTTSGEVVVCVDTSGSIGAKELAEFGGEIQSICSDLKPKKVYVIYCDAAVNKVVEFGPHDEVVLEAVGGGGTSFKPPFKWIEDNDINPRCLVYLTDGYGDFPNEDDVPFPTLWAINNMNVVAPLGETIQIQV